MRSIRVLLPTFALLVMMFATRTAKAECVGYFDLGSEDCTGKNGCENSWDELLCSFGCVSGTCSLSNSTECCGVIHRSAQIYGDGDGCSGEECGDAHRRIHVRNTHTNPQYRAELLQGYTPGLIMLSADISYKEPGLIYAFNRCSHSYEMVVEDVKIVPLGGL